MYGVGGERELTEEIADRPVRLRGGAAGADRQRRLQAAAARRVGRGARLGATCTPGPARSCQESFWPILKRAGRVRRRALGGARPRHLGGARRAAALHVVSKFMCWVALDRGARLARMYDEPDVRREVAGPGRPDPRGHLRERRRRAGGLRAALRLHGARRLVAARCRCCASCRPRTRASAPPCWPSPTSSPSDGLVLRYRVEETDDGLQGEEGTFTICSFWLVSALIEIGEVDRGRAPVRAAAVATPARSSCTPRSSTRTPAGTWATSRRRSPIWP